MSELRHSKNGSSFRTATATAAGAAETARSSPGKDDADTEAWALERLTQTATAALTFLEAHYEAQGQQLAGAIWSDDDDDDDDDDNIDDDDDDDDDDEDGGSESDDEEVERFLVDHDDQEDGGNGNARGVLRAPSLVDQHHQGPNSRSSVSSPAFNFVCPSGLPEGLKVNISHCDAIPLGSISLLQWLRNGQQTTVCLIFPL